METIWLSFGGYHFVRESLVGVGPLIRTDGQSDGLPYLEVWFELFLKEAGAQRITSGRMTSLEALEDRREKGRLIKNGYYSLLDQLGLTALERPQIPVDGD